MQPSALSVEPLIFFSILFLLFVLMPITIAIAIKARPASRALAVSLALLGIAYAAFTLGRMTGLSMAWYHWTREYKDPLWQWQFELKDRLKVGDTNGVMNMLHKFAEQNIQVYGREKLFAEGEFRRFVDGISKPAP